MTGSKAESRGIRNKNPLNLRKSSNAWMGKILPGTDKDFEQFISMQYGIRAAMINIRTIIRRHRGCTLRKLIEVWAPAFENNTCAYVKSVCRATGYKEYTVLRFEDREMIINITQAMAAVECGQPLPIDDFSKAYSMI